VGGDQARRAARRGETTIESSIWVAVLDGRASAPACARICSFDDRDVLDGQLDPEVAAGDHRAVGRAHDLLDPLDGLRRLDLGDQRQPRVGAHGGDVIGAAHEGQRDEVDADLLAEAQVLGVHLGHRGRAAAPPGILSPWREATAPPISTTASNSPSPGRVAVTRRRMRPSER